MKIVENLLTRNPYSRPGTPHNNVLALIMHWTSVPNQPAIDVCNYFENRKIGKTGYGSAHYVVDLDGLVIRCIPESEVAYHVGSTQPDPASKKIYTDWARSHFGMHVTDPAGIGPNICTLGIEMCPIDEAGDFNSATIQAATQLAADICKRLMLNPLLDIATHNMVVGWKDCPRLWVNHPEKLDEFRNAVNRGGTAMAGVFNLDLSSIGNAVQGIGKAVTDTVAGVQGKLAPDQQAALNQSVIQVQQAIDTAQSAINEKEASSSNLFIAGWRPFIGWVCGAVLAYNYLVRPLIQLIPGMPQLPVMNWDIISPVLIGLLGLGTMRTVEKIQNAQGNH